MIENIGFYTVNYKDEDRKNKMISRFDSFKPLVIEKNQRPFPVPN
jgi:hypothetical protein